MRGVPPFSICEADACRNVHCSIAAPLQVAPLDMFTEANTKTNLPAQIEITAVPGSTYSFQFMAKGGGSANKTFLYQETKALLNPGRLMAFLEEKIATLGTAACVQQISHGVHSGVNAANTSPFGCFHEVTSPSQGLRKSSRQNVWTLWLPCIPKCPTSRCGRPTVPLGHRDRWTLG